MRASPEHAALPLVALMLAGLAGCAGQKASVAGDDSLGGGR